VRVFPDVLCLIEPLYLTPHPFKLKQVKETSAPFSGEELGSSLNIYKKALRIPVG
jgi:hypothetical protein